MKFDFVIGNPPYNDERYKDSVQKNFAPTIYHLFLDAAYEIADKAEFIHPSRFLFDAGNTPKQWNEKMLADEHFKILEYEPESKKIFPNTEIKGGISISYYDKTSVFTPIHVFTPYAELNSIMNKVDVQERDSIMSIIYTQNRYNLEKVAHDCARYKEFISSEGRDKRFRNNAFARVPLFGENRIESDDIAVYGVLNNKRVCRYIRSQYVEQDHENLKSWKVIVPRANGSGAFGEILSSPIVIAPDTGYTQTFIGFGVFEDEITAKHCLKYIKSKFCRSMLGILKTTQHNERNTWKYVPLQDFTENSDIDWSKSIKEIDQQLYAKYGLTQEEIDFIESKVKEME